jgi:hypothetical protein
MAVINLTIQYGRCFLDIFDLSTYLHTQLAYYYGITVVKSFIAQASESGSSGGGPNVVKLFTAVIYD